jgi:DNA-binding GntR family transcriptional regulator
MTYSSHDRQFMAHLTAGNGGALPRAPQPAGEPPSRNAAKMERAYRRLKHDILSGVYSPNQRLVESPLTQILQIGRNTLQAVLARLDQEGLVVLEPYRGGRVRVLSLEQAHDVLRVREVLEGMVGGLAATRATSDERSRMRQAVSQADQALKDDDWMRLASLNSQFHADVVDAARCPAAASFLDSLHLPLVRSRFPAVLIPRRKAHALHEHYDLLQAIEDGDADGAERAARVHVEQIRATLAGAGQSRDEMA